MAFIELLISTLVASAAALPQYGSGTSGNPAGVNQLGPTNKYYNTPSQPGYAGQFSVQSGQALNWFQDDSSAGCTNVINEYHCYEGILASYPAMSTWLSFDSLWAANQDTISTQNADNQSIVGLIHDAIIKVSSESTVDARFILAIVLQESHAQASVECTWNKWISANNCGLMQGPPNSVCLQASQPEASIIQMIRDGVQGTTSGGNEGAGGPGLVHYLTQDYAWVHNPKLGNPFTAARAYNSGSVVADDLDHGFGATAAYVNDIANRLLGWGGDGSGSPFDAKCGTGQH